MRVNALLLAGGIVISACGGAPVPAPVDSAALAQQRTDSVLGVRTREAPALLAEARGVMVQLLKKPATASFDSLRVAQPALRNGSGPSPAVCGRLGGKPGVKGAAGMTPFIYFSKTTVFVLDAKNQSAFGELYGKTCAGPGVRVLVE